MTNALEDRLSASMQAQAARSGLPPTGLADTAIRRGRRLRRQRRAGALAGIAALVAGAAVVAASVRTDDRGLPDSYVTTVNAATWAEGALTRVPYMVGGGVLVSAGVHHPFYAELEIRSVWETADGFLVEATGEDNTNVIDGERRSSVAEITRHLVVSRDGTQAVSMPTPTDQAPGADPSTIDYIRPQALDPISVTEGAMPAGFAGGVLVVNSGPPDGPILVLDPASGDLSDTGRTGEVFDVGAPGVTLATVDGCVTAMDASWVDLWQGCELEPGMGAVSPDGGHVVAVDKGGSVVVKNALTGADVGAITVAHARVGALRWEDADHFVLSVTPSSGDPRVARCAAASGACEWAGPPPPWERAGAYPSLVLGHPLSQ